MLVMVHIDLYLYNPHQVSVSYPFISIDLASMLTLTPSVARAVTFTVDHFATV